MSIDDRDYMRAGPPSFGQRLRGLTAFHAVLGLNILVFVIQWIFQGAWVHDVLTGAFVRPLGGVSVDELIAGHFWTPFTYMFVHSSWGAFVGNMLILWFAGRRVMDLYGGRNFLLMYVLSGLVGAAVEMAISAYVLKTTSDSLMGASASVLGLLLAYGIAMPEVEVPFLSVRLWTFIKVLILANVALAGITLFGHFPAWLALEDVAYFAHLGGALAGWYFARSLGYGGVPLHLLTPPQQAAGSSLRRKPALAHAQRTRRPAVEVDMEAVRKENPRNDPLVDLMKDEIDPILDKINDFGMSSLTDEERRALERASRRFSK